MVPAVSVMAAVQSGLVKHLLLLSHGFQFWMASRCRCRCSCVQDRAAILCGQQFGPVQQSSWVSASPPCCHSGSPDLERFYIVNTHHNQIAAQDMDIEELGLEIGEIQVGAAVVAA
jgi:cytochrome c biogenesis factor